MLDGAHVGQRLSSSYKTQRAVIHQHRVKALVPNQGYHNFCLPPQ
jgi:hypothetical protein